MFARLRNFAYRHRRKFITGGLVIGGLYAATRFLHHKFIEWQEKETREFLDRSRKELHFRSTERTCNQTICSLGEALKETIKKIVDVEAVIEAIPGETKEKIGLWNELKVLVFAQLVSLLYAGLMLVILLRVKLNIMGGHMFRRSKTETPDSDFQERYLSLSHHFLNQGVKELCSIVHRHAALVLQNVALSKKMTLMDVEQVFMNIHLSMSSDPDDPLKNMSKYLLPPACSLEVEPTMKRMVDETIELLDCEEVVSVAESSLKRAFSNSVDLIAAHYPSGNGDSNFQNINEVAFPLAKVIPIVRGLNNPRNGEVDLWIQQYLQMDKINILGANLYDSFSTAK